MKTRQDKIEYLRLYRQKQKTLNKEMPLCKICTNCKKEKPKTEFHISNVDPTGLAGICKDCKREYNKSIRPILYESNKRICQKYKSRPDEEILNPSQKSCYKCGKSKSKENFYTCRSRKSGLSDACKECTLKYRNENIEKRNQYEKTRRENDPAYKMYCRLQIRLNGALKLQGVRKSKRTMELVGCNLYDFINHIENLWQDGMSWENYGKGNNKWSLDHIRPCASFNLLDVKEQKKCFHYSNLSPLWNRDNITKNSWYSGKKYSREVNNGN